MALNLALRRALLLAVMAVLVELSAASHFRGAIVQWRPVDPVNFDGRVSEYLSLIPFCLVTQNA